MNKPNGFLLYEGPSLFDNQPIVIIITGYELATQNRKTGDMLQSWIIKQGQHPSEAIKEGTDNSVCGGCPLKGKVCYVMMMPVNNIWRNYTEGKYPKVDDLILGRIRRRNRLLRLGSYGDPCAAPLEVWEPLIKKARGHTGYTHAWQYADQRWKDYLMASVEDTTLRDKAQKMGWRTFRVTEDAASLGKGEVLCKNYEDEDTKCEDCKLCNGAGKKPSIVNVVHGAKWKVNNFRELVAA